MLLAKAEWGTVPDWVTAFGTLAAFFVALRLLAKELAARREQEQDRRRSQARLVNAWLALKTRESDGEMEPWVIMKNASDEPVYGVKVTVVPADTGFASDPEVARGLPKTFELNWSLPLFPQETRERWVSAEWDWWTTEASLGLSFTDSQGRRWKRVPITGTLNEVTKRPRRSRKDLYNAWVAGELERLDY